MVNSAIGDHGNERRHTSSTPPHPISLSLPLSLLLYDLLCLGQGWCLCQARPDKKDRNHSCVQPKDPNSKLSLWHLATYFFHPWFAFFCGEHTFGLFVCFPHNLLLYPEVGGQNCNYVRLQLSKFKNIIWGRALL